MSFVKIYGTILDSSLWGEPAPTVKVFMTMLAMADQNGIVRASVPGLTRRAVVSRKECETALATLLSPDPDSMDKMRNPASDGHRIEVVEGGWLVVNHSYYRDLRTDKQVADAERIRRKRESGEYDSRGPVAPLLSVASGATRSNVATDADVDAEAYPDTETNSSTAAREISLGVVMKTLGVEGLTRPTWLAILSGMTEGLGTPGMKAVPISALFEAAQELAAAGGNVTPHRFKIFVQKVLERNGRDTDMFGNRKPQIDRIKGRTLAAARVIRSVRARRDPLFPHSLAPGWEEGFSGPMCEIIRLFQARILGDDTKGEGTLVAQLARAMEEAGL